MNLIENCCWFAGNEIFLDKKNVDYLYYLQDQMWFTDASFYSEDKGVLALLPLNDPLLMFSGPLKDQENHTALRLSCEANNDLSLCISPTT